MIFTDGVAVALILPAELKLQVMFCRVGVMNDIGATVFIPIARVCDAAQLVNGSLAMTV
jgi:hypothetical protein